MQGPGFNSRPPQQRKCTVQRIWRQGKNSGMHVCRKRTKNCGRRVQLYCDRICEVPLHHRTTIRE